MFWAIVITSLVLAAVDHVRAIRKQRRARAEWEQAEQAAQQAAKAAAEQAEREKAEKAARKLAEQETKRAETERRRAERLEAARLLAEYKEREAKAARELREAQRAATVPAAQPAQQAQPEQPAARPILEMTLSEFAARVAKRPAPARPVQSFAGEIVAFTGTIPTMTRVEAIHATEERGGKGCAHINTRCTLLVIGEGANPGNTSRTAAERYHTQTITWQEWFARAEISYRRRMVARSVLAERGLA